jgi:hypothetical protein
MEKKTTYSTSHQTYYANNKNEINERRREYARQHQREYREKIRATTPPKNQSRGRPRKTNEVAPI